MRGKRPTGDPSFREQYGWKIQNPVIHVTVCVLTYKRPELLRLCLDSLGRQEANGFRFSIVVVDNDIDQAARSIVTSWGVAAPVEVAYFCEPRQNIALARNLAVRKSSGHYVAFIDDDETAGYHWLLNLVRAVGRFDADGVLGPVKPHYLPSAPKWLIRSGLCLRESFPTGKTILNEKFMRTGNVLFRRRIVEGCAEPFDVRFGRSGGEDTDFFRRMLDSGYRFVWCREAEVFEAVTADRQTRWYHIRRALLRGATRAKTDPVLSRRTLKSAIATMVYALALPVLLVSGQHMFMRYLVRFCDHAGKLLAYGGMRLPSVRR